MEKFAVLIPVYNEETTVESLAEQLEALELRYLFVDDGSTDKTVTNLWMKDLPYLAYFPNRGKGFAIKLGAHYLIKEGYEWILIIDGDGQCAIEDIEKFDSALLFGEQDYAIFIGNRLWAKALMPKLRYYTNKIMSWIISKIAGQTIEDTQCGFRLIHKGVFELVNLKEDGFAMESEMLIQTSRIGGKIKSVPIQCKYFKNRKSKIHIFKDTFRFLRALCRLRNYY